MRHTITHLALCLGAPLMAALPMAYGQNYDLTHAAFTGGGGVSNGPGLTLRAAIGQPITAGDGGLLNPGTTGSAAGSCETIADCADLDGNGIRDDNCTFWACESGTCVGQDIVFADMGGQFGACTPDGTADGNDRFMALNCFSNVDPAQPEQDFPCEADAPVAFNVDAGGQFGSCAPDGVCDGNDAFTALNAFSGMSSCTCPLDGAPSPVMPPMPVVADEVTIELAATDAASGSGDLVEIEVFITDGVSDLRGYQLHPVASPGLELVDMFVDARDDHAFTDRTFWDAYNLETGQMVVGIDDMGIRSKRERLYLGTLVYRVASKNDPLMVDLQHDNTDSAQRTFLFATPARGKVAITETLPAIIRIGDRNTR